MQVQSKRHWRAPTKLFGSLIYYVFNTRIDAEDIPLLPDAALEKAARKVTKPLHWLFRRLVIEPFARELGNVAACEPVATRATTLPPS